MLTAEEDAELVQSFERGVELMDKLQHEQRSGNLPPRCPDWRAKIGKKKIVISGHDTCILGRIFGDMMDGVHQMQVIATTIHRLGFDTGDSLVGPPVPDQKIKAIYARLDELWNGVLRGKPT